MHYFKSVTCRSKYNCHIFFLPVQKLCIFYSVTTRVVFCGKYDSRSLKGLGSVMLRSMIVWSYHTLGDLLRLSILAQYQRLPLVNSKIN